MPALIATPEGHFTADLAGAADGPLVLLLHGYPQTPARFTADFITGPFQLEVLPGIGHFVTDQDPETVTRGLLSHLARHR
ncbi:MAG: hypothetical protein ACREMG_04780 [Gemmatimonadales bacterium]